MNNLIALIHRTPKLSSKDKKEMETFVREHLNCSDNFVIKSDSYVLARTAVIRISDLSIRNYLSLKVKKERNYRNSWYSNSHLSTNVIEERWLSIKAILIQLNTPKKRKSTPLTLTAAILAVLALILLTLFNLIK